jgi:hypothetical protein
VTLVLVLVLVLSLLLVIVLVFVVAVAVAVKSTGISPLAAVVVVRRAVVLEEPSLALNLPVHVLVSPSPNHTWCSLQVWFMHIRGMEVPPRESIQLTERRPPLLLLLMLMLLATL